MCGSNSLFRDDPVFLVFLFFFFLFFLFVFCFFFFLILGPFKGLKHL